MAWTLSLVLIASTVLAGGFFAGTETGFTSARRIRLIHRARSGTRRAILAARLVHERERVVIAAVVGTSVMTVAGSALATVAFTQRYGESGETIAAVLLTVLSIVFGEVIPKSLYRAHPETLLSWSALPFVLGTRALFPLQWAILSASRAILRALGQSPGGTSSRLTKERIAKTFELSIRAEELEEVEEQLVQRFLRSSHLTLTQVMRPLHAATVVRTGDAVAVALSLVRTTGHSRLPLLEESGDIRGLVLFRDLIHAAPHEPVEEYARTMVSLAASMGLDEAIAALAHQQTSMAAVVDETDVAVGILTLEDLLKPLLGEMADEHDAQRGAVASERLAAEPGRARG